MPKVKTKTTAAKRLRRTKKGKILHRHSSISHYKEHQSSGRKRRKRQLMTLGPSERHKAQGFLGKKGRR